MTIRPRGAARSARLPVTQEDQSGHPCPIGARVQIPSGTLDKTARYANRQSGEAQTFVNVCGFDSHPCYWRTTTCVGWALAGPAGCKPAVRKDPGGSTPSRRTQRDLFDGAVRCWFCSEAFNLANAGSIPVRVAVWLGVMLVLQSGPQPGRTRGPVRFPSESLDAAKWWNLVDTRRSEGRARKGVRVQVSPWLLTERLQVGRDPTGFHTAGVPGSIPGPATCGWASAHSGLISLDCRCATPGPATRGVSILLAINAQWHEGSLPHLAAEYAKQAKRRVENLVILQVRFLPRSLARSRGPAAKTPG